MGNEEILLCACDDGDVIGYTTRSIQYAFENRVAEDDGHSIEPEAPRPMVIFNVGESAWGLAIHKEARMIAVSANSRQITVIAFALGRPSSPASSSGSDHSGTPREDTEAPLSFPSNEAALEDWDTGHEQGPYNRSHNLTISLIGHWQNIPDITFCNTEDDPIGRYLISTDIAGVTLIWDIWKRMGVKKYAPVLSDREYLNYSQTT